MTIQQPTFQPILNVDIVNSSDAKITNLNLILADTEYSLALVNGLKELRIKCREYADLKYSFVSGESATKYFTIWRGVCDNLTDLDFNTKTLYIQSSKANVTIEVMELY